MIAIVVVAALSLLVGATFGLFAGAVLGARRREHLEEALARHVALCGGGVPGVAPGRHAGRPGDAELTGPELRGSQARSSP